MLSLVFELYRIDVMVEIELIPVVYYRRGICTLLSSKMQLVFVESVFIVLSICDTDGLVIR